MLRRLWVNRMFRAVLTSAGQDLVEYALVIAVVALASVVALGALAGQLTAVWNVAAAWFNRPLP